MSSFLHVLAVSHSEMNGNLILTCVYSLKIGFLLDCIEGFGGLFPCVFLGKLSNIGAKNQRKYVLYNDFRETFGSIPGHPGVRVRNVHGPIIGQVQAFIPEGLDLGNSCLCRGDMDNGATTLRPRCTSRERD